MPIPGIDQFAKHFCDKYSQAVAKLVKDRDVY